MHEATVIGSGSIGGKAAGYFKAKNCLERNTSGRLYFPKTACIAADVFSAYIAENNLTTAIQSYRWEEEGAFDQLRDHFLKGRFSKTTLVAFRKILQQMDFPLAIRSSSLLEDRPGTSFAGKYSTLFIRNRGTMDERLQDLCQTIQKVYASTYNPNAIFYRKKHGLFKGTDGDSRSGGDRPGI